MATSGTTAWALTARDVVTHAMGELAILPIGDDPDADEMTYGLFQLNALLKGWGGAHLETTGTVTIPANTESGTLGSDVQDVISARHVGTFERQLARWERDEYLSLPNKEASGEPSAFYVSNQRDATVMYVWPVPTVETTIAIDYRRVPETVTDANETVDFPPDCHNALVANLALRIAGRFGAPLSQELVARATTLRREMEDADRPASYYLGAA